MNRAAPSSTSCYVHAQLPNSGLGNKLVVWARAVVFARLNGLPLVVSGWCRPNVRNYFRCGDLRLYWNYFTPWQEMGWWQSRQIRSTGRVVREPEVRKLAEPPLPGTVFEFSRLPFWRRLFRSFADHRELVRRELESHLTPARLREIAAVPDPVICVQVRMGDFRQLRANERFDLAGNTRTPLDYFIQMIAAIRELHGSELPVTIVSDGTREELAPLLALPGVTHNPGRSSIADLMLMARSKLLVCAAGSTYSLWGGFLGNNVLLHHPDHFHYLVRRPGECGEQYEGAVQPEQPALWPERLRADVTDLFKPDYETPPAETWANVPPAPAANAAASPPPTFRVLHMPFSYFPSPCGGTEVYVDALCRELAAGGGIGNIVAAPGERDERTEHHGVPVRRFAASSDLSLEMLICRGDPRAGQKMAALLDEVRPDLVHFHANSPAVSLPVLKEVRKRGISTVYTYHTPTMSCHRGTLMRWGATPCDGKLRPLTCAACQLASFGLPPPVAWLVSLLSTLTKPLVRLLPASARWQVPARAFALARQRHEAIREWWEGMDRIVALCAWTRRLLDINQVPASRVRLVRHGLTQRGITSTPPAPLPARPLRLIFLGRLDPTKGLHLLVDALAADPALPVRLDVYTVLDKVPGPYVRQMQRRIAADGRIQICPSVPAHQVPDIMRSYHALVVPSVWFETGPLVVLEAFAVGLPVVGSGFGGIAEWVTHNVDGLHVAQPRSKAWLAALQRLVREPDLLAALRSNIRPPRSMQEVAADMQKIYLEVLSEAGHWETST